MLEGRLGVSERVGDGGSANGDRRPVKGSEWSVERQRCCCCSLHHLGHVFESSSPKARLAGARAGLGGCLAQPIFTPPAKPRRTQRQPVDPPFYSSIHPHPAPPPLSTLPIPTSQWPSNPLPACSAAPSCSTFPSPLALVSPPATVGGTVTTFPPSATAMPSTRRLRTSAPLPLARNKYPDRSLLRKISYVHWRIEGIDAGSSGGHCIIGGVSGPQINQTSGHYD